jgi:hypothetical protein
MFGFNSSLERQGATKGTEIAIAKPYNEIAATATLWLMLLWPTL